MEKSRRDFLKILGTGLGGLTLSSCGSSGGGNASGESETYGPLPSGYRYFSVFKSGNKLPDGTISDFLPGSAMINDQSEIYFHAIDTSQRSGCYELKIDFDGDRPAVISERTVIADGDLLADGNRVTRIRQSDISKHGTFVTVVKLEKNVGRGVYLEREKGVFTRVAGFLDRIPGGAGVFSQSFGDVDVHDNNDILLVARFSDDNSNRPRQGVFFFPDGKNDTNAKIVAINSDILPGADGLIRSFGLVDLNNNGNYVIQASVQATSVHAKSTDSLLEETPMSALVMGYVDDDAPSVLLTPAKNMNISAAAKTTGLLSAEGDVLYGPRIGTFENPAHIVHHTEDHLALYYNGVRVAQCDDRSPDGFSIESFGAPVIGDDGLLYYSIVTDGGVELCAYNGTDTITILSRGDQIEDGGIVNDITFGMQTEHVDSQGRLSFIVEFTDGSSAVVVGIPV